MSAAEECLRTPIIVQKIIERLCSKDRRYMKLRLLNAFFDSEVLRRIRRDHRSIRMEVPKAQNFRWLGEEPVEIEDILVNKRAIKTRRILWYLKFLRRVVNVKAENLVMIDFWATVSCEEWRKQLHDEIHKLLENQTLTTFVGMSDLCDGFCDKCYLLAGTASQYGPLQAGISASLLKNETHFHFEKLIISERHLHGIASNAGKEDLKFYVNPRISCDQLCFRISEFPYNCKKRIRSRPLPFEVIMEMCDVWKADSISIEYDFWPQSLSTREKWSKKGIFTPFRLDELHEKTDNESDKSKKKLSSVTIDMTNTRVIYRELIGTIDKNHSYCNLMSNIRQVFPTDKVIIVGDRYMCHFGMPDLCQENFEKILSSIWKNLGQLEVTIKHDIATVSFADDYDIPDSINILGHQLSCTLLPEKLCSREGYIGILYKITDENGEKTLNLEVFIRDFILSAREDARRLDNIEDLVGPGFWKHFY